MSAAAAWRLVVSCALVMSACGGSIGAGERVTDADAALVDASGMDSSSLPDLEGETGGHTEVDTGGIEVVDVSEPEEPPEDVGAARGDVPVDDAPAPVWGRCVLLASDPSPKLVDTWRGTTRRVEFAVEGIPAGVEVATLHYFGYDVDHPGAEGWIVVNGGPRIALPADAALDNEGRTFTVDVTGQTIEGRNAVAFVAFDSPEGSFYRISDVALEVEGFDLPCASVGGPTGMGVERVMSYREATWDQRNNWVLDCRDYAYTARGDEHMACDALYAPDGTTHGRAVFVFRAVIPDRYEVQVEGRHTTNRNPAGMLVRVEGVGERRIAQDDDRGMVWDRFGLADLGGEVRVIIDSTREVGSDAVRRVRLLPVR